MGFPAGRHRVYLDHAATTPMDEAVLAAMAPYNSDMFANPASLHHPGVQARLAMQKATQRFAAALNTLPQSLIWTSGGTESNNLVIQGLCARYRREHGRTGHLIVSSVEHSAVLAVAEHLQHTQGWQVSVLPV
ncbi:MAG: aminotransferase class V-fold PLP-dependent enzyme, partial [Vampirovibrionales bacterium]|nr:aminotransferase class V-fold PLP-dependent enzyme [Vampirovibrionales bacterium]